MFVTFEGVDGSGKTTQAELLAAHLSGQGGEVVATREPGGTPLGGRVRELLLEGAAVSAWTEAAPFAAARAELVERVIRPALERGAAVVCDRYLDSSLAYQGIARGLRVERVLELNLYVIGGVLPDRTFVLSLDPKAAEVRLGSRRDRIEREGSGFLAEVDRAYRELAGMYPGRVKILDGTLPPAELAGLVREELAALV